MSALIEFGELEKTCADLLAAQVTESLLHVLLRLLTKLSSFKVYRNCHRISVFDDDPSNGK